MTADEIPNCRMCGRATTTRARLNYCAGPWAPIKSRDFPACLTGCSKRLHHLADEIWALAEEGSAVAGSIDPELSD